VSNHFISDSLLKHQVFLQGVATHEARTFEPFLLKADRIIRDVLSKSGDRIDTTRALNAIIRQLRDELGANYSEWGAELLSDMEELAGVEANFTSNTIDRAVIGRDVKTPTASQVFAAANIRPIQINAKGESELMGFLVRSFSQIQVKRVNSTIRNGFFSGATIQEMITAIRGTKKNQFKDGVLITTRRNAETIARTATNHVSNIARQTTYAANQDIIKGWRFSATLDDRTSNVCRFNDQQEFPINEGPFPPLHLGCRSSSEPVLKKKFDIFGDSGTRASKGSKGGQQTNASDYYDWLGRQSKPFQQQVLGKAKTDLFRKGGLSAKEFRKLTSDSMGEPLTLDQIQALDPIAWDRAGLDD